MNLNPDQFFHGTTHAIDGMVRPADAAGTDVSEYSFGDPGDMSEGDHAFAIRNSEGYAWHAAHTFHSNGRRPRVYEVEPAKDMKPGPWNKDHPNFLEHHGLDDPDSMDMSGDDSRFVSGMKEDIADARANHQDEWASKTGFPVKKRIDTMPGRQGTFPSVNWHRFQTSGPYGGTGPSHPDDDQVRYGMGGIAHTHSEALKEHTALSSDQFHDWRKDPAPHSVLREEMGRPQKRWATLLDD